MSNSQKCASCEATTQLVYSMQKDLKLMNARMQKLTSSMSGGSIASDYVMNNVSPEVFDAMDANFTNEVEDFSGGGSGEVSAEEMGIEEFDLIDSAKSLLDSAFTKPFKLKGGSGKEFTPAGVALQAAELIEKYQPLAKGWFDAWKAQLATKTGGGNDTHHAKLELSDIAPLLSMSKGILNNALNKVSMEKAQSIASALSEQSLNETLASLAPQKEFSITKHPMAEKVARALLNKYGAQLVEKVVPFMEMSDDNRAKLAAISGGMGEAINAWTSAFPRSLTDSAAWNVISNPGGWLSSNGGGEEPVSYSTPHLSSIDRGPMPGVKPTENIQALRNNTLLATLDAVHAVPRTHADKVMTYGGSDDDNDDLPDKMPPIFGVKGKEKHGKNAKGSAVSLINLSGGSASRI